MNKKGLLALMFSSVLMLSSVTPSFAQNVGIKINGKYIESDVAPQIIEGRTMVPVRPIFEGVGAEVSWDAETKTITGKKNNLTVKMVIGNNIMNVNGNEVEMDASAAIIDERTYAPARYVAEAFGFDVSWNPQAKEVLIISKTTETTTVETTTEQTTKATETTTKTAPKKETTTETTTLSAAEILNQSPVEGVGMSLYKLVKTDTLNAFKIYYIGNANNNRFLQSTYNKLMVMWDSGANTQDEKLFVAYSKQVYKNMVLTCKKIDQRTAKYPGNTNVYTFSTNRKDALEKLLVTYFSSKNIETAKANADKIKTFAATTPNT